MSKFANIFLQTLNEEKEGNAFTAKLAKTKKGGKFELGGKKFKDTSDHDDPSVKEEGKMSSSEKKKKGEISKSLSTKEFNKRYGKAKGKNIKYATATKLAMHKESMYPEAEEPAPAQEPSDEEAWKASLDKGTNPADFDVEDNPQLNIDTSGVEAARQWIAKLEEMAEFVNGTGPESLNSKINELEVKNSIPFRGVVRREEKRITKVAENLRGLAEVFKSVVITSQKKIKDANER